MQPILDCSCEEIGGASRADMGTWVVMGKVEFLDLIASACVFCILCSLQNAMAPGLGGWTLLVFTLGRWVQSRHDRGDLAIAITEKRNTR